MKLTLILVVFVRFIAISVSDELLVRCNNGFLKGMYMVTERGREFRAFLGIPYAVPPVGELRFKPPLPMTNWHGIRNATNVHPACPQKNNVIKRPAFGNEDCLFLNVYTPKKSKVLYPVLINIHGGMFYVNSGNTISQGPSIMMNRDIVLITLNYRLGALGFLSTGDNVVYGNNALRDQNMVFKWVQNNIARFGGDPKKVTIFGHSSGGIAVHLHLVSPKNKGLFQSVISQSGSALGDYACVPMEKAAEISKKLARLLNCPTHDSHEMVDCLRSKTAEEIVSQHENFMTFGIDPVAVFLPSKEPNHKDAFLPDFPENLIKSGLANDVPWLTGITSEDGAIRSAEFYEGPVEQLRSYDKNFDNLLNDTLLIYRTVNTKSVGAKIRKFYFGNRKLSYETAHNFTNLVTDGLILNNIIKSIDLHLKYLKSPVFYYLFGYRGHNSFSVLYAYNKTANYGVCHGDELLYLFDKPPVFNQTEKTQEDLQMEDILTTLWANFAKYSNPTPEYSSSLPSSTLSFSTWLPVKSTNYEYYYIGGLSRDDLMMRDKVYNERVQFWKSLSDVRTEE